MRVGRGFGPVLLGLAAALGAGAGAGAAPCPSPQDLATGIAMRDDAGGVTVFRRGAAPGEVIETTRFDDGSGYFVRAAGGLLVLETYDLENGEKVESSVIETELDDRAAAFPVAEGRRSEVKARERAADGATERAVTLVVETSLMRAVTYGDCTLSAIPVRVSYRYGGEAQPAELEYLDYLPDYGIALYLGGAQQGQAPDIYRVLELFAAPPE